MRPRRSTLDRAVSPEGRGEHSRVGAGRAWSLLRVTAAWCLPGTAGGPAQAGHHDLADRRDPQPARGGVLLPPAGREPRGVLPLPAGAQRPHVRRPLRAGPGRRRLPGRAAAAGLGHGRRDRPGARLRAQLLGRELRPGSDARLRILDPPGVGMADQAGREPGQPAGVRPACRLPRPRWPRRPAVTTVAAGTDAFSVFGTTATLLVSEPGMLETARAVADAELAAVDRACSRFRLDSELSRLNAAEGAVTSVSELFAELVEAALRAARLTDGDVDPTCGQALAGIGYDRDFRLLQAPKPPAAAGRPRRHPRPAGRPPARA